MRLAGTAAVLVTAAFPALAITPVPTRPSTPTPTRTPVRTSTPIPAATSTPTPPLPTPTSTPVPSPPPPSPTPPPLASPTAGPAATPLPPGGPIVVSLTDPFAVTITLRNAPANGKVRFTLSTQDGAKRATFEFSMGSSPSNPWTHALTITGFGPGSGALVEVFFPGGALATTAQRTLP